MPTHVALLRGINVGGTGKIAMADLRALMSSLGHAQVATYIQSGNVVFTPEPADPDVIAAGLRAAILEKFGLDRPVMVVTRDELAEVVSANPYPDEPEPRYLHAVFLPAELGGDARQRLDATPTGPHEFTLLGRTLYLHTPGGFGTSELANALLNKRNSPVAGGTARNWSTVTKLLALCDAAC